jgi:hypothetical protein
MPRTSEALMAQYLNVRRVSEALLSFRLSISYSMIVRSQASGEFLHGQPNVLQ